MAGSYTRTQKEFLGSPVSSNEPLTFDDQEGQDGHDRQGDDQRGKQRERDRQREGQEELADEAAGKAEGQEDSDRGQRARGDGARDLARPLDDAVSRSSPRARCR